MAESASCVPQRILSCLHSLDLLLNQSEPVVCSYTKADVSGSGSKASREGLVKSICNILGIYILDKIFERPLDLSVFPQKKTHTVTGVAMAFVKGQ